MSWREPSKAKTGWQHCSVVTIVQNWDLFNQSCPKSTKGLRDPPSLLTPRRCRCWKLPSERRSAHRVVQSIPRRIMGTSGQGAPCNQVLLLLQHRNWRCAQGFPTEWLQCQYKKMYVNLSHSLDGPVRWVIAKLQLIREGFTKVATLGSSPTSKMGSRTRRGRQRQVRGTGQAYGCRSGGSLGNVFLPLLGMHRQSINHFLINNEC